MTRVTSVNAGVCVSEDGKEQRKEEYLMGLVRVPGLGYVQTHLIELKLHLLQCVEVVVMLGSAPHHAAAQHNLLRLLKQPTFYSAQCSLYIRPP